MFEIKLHKMCVVLYDVTVPFHVIVTYGVVVTYDGIVTYDKLSFQSPSTYAGNRWRALNYTLDR